MEFNQQFLHLYLSLNDAIAMKILKLGTYYPSETVQRVVSQLGFAIDHVILKLLHKFSSDIN